MTWANIVTGIRLLLFVAFIALVEQRQLLLAALLFALAWGLDAVDGWLARRFGQATNYGYLFDKVVDRVVIIGAVLVLLIEGLVPDMAVLLLTKDIAALPVLSVSAMSGKRVAGAGWSGKAVTVLQGVGVLWLLVGWPYAAVVVLAVALLGGIVGARYMYGVFYD